MRHLQGLNLRFLQEVVLLVILPLLLAGCWLPVPCPPGGCPPWGCPSWLDACEDDSRLPWEREVPDPLLQDDDDSAGDDDDSAGDDDSAAGPEIQGVVTFAFTLEVPDAIGRSWGRDTGDDDSAGDDDDSADAGDDDSAGDDDDSAGDDDDSTGDDDSAGDDDDSTGDDDSAGDDDVAGDDDSAGDDDDAGEDRVAGTYTLTFYSDAASGSIECAQTFSFEADLEIGPLSGCGHCLSQLVVDPSSVADTTDASTNSSHCPSVWLEGEPWNAGSELLLPLAVGGAGDLLSLALVDAATLAAGSGALAQDGGVAVADLREAWDDLGLDMSHVGYVRAWAGSHSHSYGLVDRAAPAEEDSPWVAFWQVYRNPGSNPSQGAEFAGTFGGQGLWALSLPAP